MYCVVRLWKVPAVFAYISIGICGICSANAQTNQPSQRPLFTVQLNRPIEDVDAMAARMKTNGDLYKKIRDDGLDEYTKTHPQASSYDDQARTLIKLFAYLVVWDDFYGENLWELGSDYIRTAAMHGVRDPLFNAFNIIVAGPHVPPDKEERAMQIIDDTDKFMATGYPAAFKQMVSQIAINGLVCYRNNQKVDINMPSMLARAHVVEEWGQSYQELVKQKLPHEILFSWGKENMGGAQYNEITLNRVIAEIDRAFNEEDPDNPVKLELDGAYYVEHAWYARGSGWANTVNPQQWDQFSKDLVKAAQILEPLYNQHPDEVGISLSMMTVELGQGQGHDRMELWFQRGLKANPDCYRLYWSKQWYLQPRWEGSEEDILSFGKECVQTQNWVDKLPMILPIGLNDVQDPQVFARPDVWPIVEKTYRDYLDRYPKATHFRTLFAVQAYQGGHMDIAREQVKILGNDCDFHTISPQQFQEITADSK